MAIHSSVLAWRIPGTGEPGGLPSLGSHRVGHDWHNLAAAAAVCLLIPNSWLTPSLHVPHYVSAVCFRYLYVFSFLTQNYIQDQKKEGSRNKQRRRNTRILITVSVFTYLELSELEVICHEHKLQILYRLLQFCLWLSFPVLFYIKHYHSGTILSLNLTISNRFLIWEDRGKTL